MEVMIGTCHLNLPIGQTPQPRCDGGNIRTDNTRVGHEYHVTLQQFPVCFDERTEASGADFLLTFKDKLHIMLQQVVLVDILESLRLHERLSLVIIGTACPDMAVFHDRLERFGLPQLERLGRHHVIMPVNQYGFRLRVDHPLGIDHRIPL